MDKQNRKRVKKTQRRIEGEKHIDSLGTTLKNIPNWKTPGDDGIHGFWCKNSPQSMTDKSSK